MKILDCALLVIVLLLMFCSYMAGKTSPEKSLIAEKTALEIKVLQHELKAYEEMDKELAE